MKVVCISSGELEGASSKKVTLTEGKIYDVIRVIKGNSLNEDQFCIANDEGTFNFYCSLRFKKLQEWRHIKLMEIL